MAIDSTLPGWFDTEKIFALGAGWYFGSRDGLHVGPYDNHKIARAKGEKVGKRLKTLKAPDDQLRFVRQFLHKEWDEVGATGNFDPQQAQANDDNAADPVRAGERQKNWYRSGRFFKVDGVWFFSTREEIDVGPFATEAEARRHERRLVAILARTQTPEQAHRAIYEYKHRPAAA